MVSFDVVYETDPIFTNFLKTYKWNNNIFHTKHQGVKNCLRQLHMCQPRIRKSHQFLLNTLLELSVPSLSPDIASLMLSNACCHHYCFDDETHLTNCHLTQYVWKSRFVSKVVKSYTLYMSHYGLTFLYKSMYTEIFFSCFFPL